MIATPFKFIFLSFHFLTFFFFNHRTTQDEINVEFQKEDPASVNENGDPEMHVTDKSDVVKGLSGDYQTCVSTFVCGKFKTPGSIYEHPTDNPVASVLVSEPGEGATPPFFSSLSNHQSGVSHSDCSKAAEKYGFYDQKSDNWELQRDEELSLFKIFSSSLPTHDEISSIFSPYVIVNQVWNYIDSFLILFDLICE